MPTCNQTNEPLTPLTQSLFDACTKSFYKEIGWPSIECPPPQVRIFEVVVIDETLIKIDGVHYTPTIGNEWVDLKEVGVPGEVYMGRSWVMPTFSWEQMMDLYKEGQTVFEIQTNG